MAQFLPSLTPALDANGNPIPSAVWEFFSKGTTTPALIASGASRVTSAQDGTFGFVNLVTSTSYRALLRSADGSTLFEVSSVSESLFEAGVKSAVDNMGATQSGAVWSFYAAGTDTPQAVYSDDSLETPLGPQVFADADGRFPEIHLDTALSYKAVLSFNGVEQSTIDPVTEGSIALFLDPTFQAPLEPGDDWDGTAGTGFTTTPSDPTRTTAKPIVKPLFLPRQTVTDTLTIGVGAGANNNGSLFDNLGLESVTFHLEGNSRVITSPSLRSYTRPDGSIWYCLGWWVNIKKTSTNGWGDLYIEAEPKDTTMQNRVIGPISMRFAETEHDWTGTVGAGGDYADMGAAFNAIAAAAPENPVIVPITAGDLKLSQGSATYNPEGWCTIRPTAAVTFVEDPPALDGDFTRLRPRIGNLCFDGSNVTVDFVETLQFNPLSSGVSPAFINGAKIRQSRGREDLWRKVPRNLIPALFSGNSGETVYLEGADIRDVNDVADKSPLFMGCVTDETWADLAQGALCWVGNKTTDHSSAFYYTNVDAMRITYSGTGTPTVSIRNSPRRIVLRVDGADVATFTPYNAFSSASAADQAFRDDLTYRVASAVAFVNAQANWSATLIDDSRAAVSLSPPGTTNGNPQEDIAIPATLPTHFDIHSDLHQVPNSAFLENVYRAQNECWDNDTQNLLDPENTPGNIKDFLTILNVFHNRTALPGEPPLPDEALQSATGQGSHNVCVGNTFATQRLTVATASNGSDAYSLVGGNVSVRLTAVTAHPDLVVKDNHITQDVGTTPAATGTSVGGDFRTLFADAANGDFSPAGLLLTNTITPLLPRDITGAVLSGVTEKGAVA